MIGMSLLALVLLGIWIAIGLYVAPVPLPKGFWNKVRAIMLWFL